jgi:Putative DNA-binding domain
LSHGYPIAAMPQIQSGQDIFTESDIQALVSGAVRESRRIEYKRALPGNADEDKREFLADVSSFANAAGGDLLFGVDEDRGVPTSVPGLHVDNLDAEILRLESIIRAGIEPRIPAVRMEPVSLASGGFVLVLRVPQSWALPHMVTFKNLSRFYSRNSAGKYQLDVSELRNLFARGGEAADRVRRFRDERLARIVADEGALPLISSRTLMILHLVPLRLFDPGTYHDLRRVEGTDELRTSMLGGGGTRWNVDGYATFGDLDKDGTRFGTYVQLFRHGAIEAVDMNMLRPREDGALIPGELLARTLLIAIPRFMGAQRRVGVELPIAVLVTLVGVKGHRLAGNLYWGSHGGHPIDRDVIQAADVIVEDWEKPLDPAIRPALDTIWNAAGWRQCDFYNESGELHFPD